MDARAITVALRGKWQGRYGLCRCPAHADRTPSLKVSDDPRKSDGIDLHCFAGCDWQDVKAELHRQGLLDQTNGVERHHVERAPIAETNDLAERTECAQKIWQASVPLRDTLGWRYFTERRELHVGLLDDFGHCLRWHHGEGAVIGLMTDPTSNELTGVHRTYLNRDATKRERKMLGKQGVIHLSPDDEVTQGLGICEGIETGLRILLSGWSPIWCAGSAGGIRSFPVLSGIEALTIFVDDDETETGINAARDCADRWTAADREVRLARTKDCFDGI